MSSRIRVGEQAENMSSEISYPQEELNPADVEDILDRLHIGTLRREELRKARQSLMNAADEEAALNNEDMDVLYNDENPEVRRKSGPYLHRHSSRSSGTSIGSGASGSSEDARASNRSNESSGVRPKSSSDMAIQTTIGRHPGRQLKEYKDSSTEHDVERQLPEKERKLSTKEKMKKLFKRKSSSNQDSNANSVSAENLIELPQVFIVKYMGSRPTKGLWGIKHTRGPIEDVVDTVGKMPKGADLPLVCLMVNQEGLAMAPHKRNKIKTFHSVSIPIQYVSYGLQDTVYPRIFSFIMVKEMSSQSKKLECYVYACDSTKSARKLAACLAFAFKEYSETLSGGTYKFTVDIPMRRIDDDDRDDAKSSYDA